MRVAHVDQRDEAITFRDIADWSSRSPGLEAVERLHGPGGAEKLGARVVVEKPVIVANARRLYDNFMRIARRSFA